jgi:hypothetical protein
MAIEFPTILGSCQIKSFNYSDQDIDRTTTQMESGAKRRRQRTKNIPSDFGVMFLFDLTQLGVFDYFNQEILESMTLEFEITLKTGQGNITHTVKYAQPPSRRKLGKKYEVACQLEASSRPVS